MLTPLRVLIIEDSEIDADLIRYHLGKAGFELTWERVETAEDMQAALESRIWDIIISDYNLPGFSAPAALALLQQSQLEIPFIIDSGTISEETALDLMRTGAADYLMKDRLARLGVLVRREINISQIRRERREAQIALNQSEDRLRTIIQASPSIIMQIDRDEKVLWINRTLPKRSREEVIGTSIYQLLPPTERAKMKLTLATMVEDHQAADYESQITSSGGEIVWYQNYVTPVIEDGQVTSFIYNSIDITRRKRAEISLRESQMLVKEEELYLRTILQTTTEGFWMLDSQGKVLDANQAYCHMSGYSLQELKQFSINDMEAVEDFAATQARINRIQASGSERFETRHHRKNGTIFDVEISVSYLAEYGGRFICFCRDISERKQYEAQLISRMNALTSPLDQLEDFEFKDMFDLKAIQNLQDEFSAATGVASIITYPDGTPITQPSNFCRLCRDIIRKTEKGQMNCFKSDAAIGRANLEGPMIQPCMSGGLWDAGAGISVGGRHIANWLIGQVRNETQTHNQMREYARQIGADETEFIEAFHEVPAMSQEKFQQLAQLLFTLASQLSETAFQNVQQARFINERKQAEERLRESELKLSLIINKSRDAIGASNNSIHILVNPAYVTMFGYTSEADLIGRPVADLIAPDQRAYVTDNIQRRTRNEPAPEFYETRGLRKDGSSFDMEVAVSIYKLNNETYNLVIIRDISDRKNAEAALKENEYFIKETQRVGVIGSYKTDFITGFWESSEVLDNIFGIDRNYIRSVQGWLDIVYPEDRELMSRYLQNEVIAKHKPFNFEYRILRQSDRAIRWVHGLGEVDFDPHGNVLSLIGTIQDITERKQAELVQQFNAERVQALLKLNQMTDATLQQITQYALEEAVRLTQSKIGYLAFLNEDESVLTMHAWSSQAMQDYEKLDKPLVFRLDDTGPWVEAVRQRQAVMTNNYASQNSLIKGVPKEHIRIDRHMDVPILVRNQMVLVAGVGNKDLDYDENDVQQLRLLMEGMWRLIERLKSEEELARHREHLEDLVAQRTAQLSAANQELQAFSYSVSHDLRAPLRALDGYSEILLSDYAGLLDDQGQNYLRRIQDASHRMGQLINDLLHLSHITRAELSIQQVNLSALAQEISIELQARHPDHCPVNWEISANLVVEGDTNLLKIALENLLNNAFKFTSQREMAQIAFGLAEQLGQNIYFIRDNGVGFNMEYAEKLFAPFQRLHSGKEFPGTGIGLSIVQRVISRHGGRIWPESEVGRGTTFYFTLNHNP